jgi:ferredoxin
MSTVRTDKASQQRARIVRWSILGVILVGITTIVTIHVNFNGAGKPVGVDALCPFGGVETLYSLISGAGFIEKTAASAVVLLLGMLGMALVFRRSFCGQLCPLGALQGIFGAIGGKLFKRHPEVPRAIDRPARWLKYVVLVVFGVWTWQAATLVMRPFDPWVAWAHLSSPEVIAEFGIGLGVLGVSLAGSLVYERFFCKYLCPTGALLGLISKVSLFNIKRDADACINCSACDKACPMNIEVMSADVVNSSECISCNECVNVCPAAGALEVKTPSKARTSPLALTGITVGIIAAAVGISTLTGTFTWRMPTLAEAIEQQRDGHGGESAGAESGEAGGAAFDSTAIKGYMSMQEISEATGIPAEEFTATWGVPAEDLGKPMKEIKEQYGFSPDEVKTWVAEQLNK